MHKPSNNQNQPDLTDNNNLHAGDCRIGKQYIGNSTKYMPDSNTWNLIIGCQLTNLNKPNDTFNLACRYITRTYFPFCCSQMPYSKCISKSTKSRYDPSINPDIIMENSVVNCVPVNCVPVNCVSVTFLHV